MTTTRTITKTLRTVLLLTVLTPAPLFAAEQAQSARQRLAQAQTQSQTQAVKGEVKRINRGLILNDAQAAESSPNAQRPVVIPAISQTPAPAPAATVETPKTEALKLDAPKVE